MTLSSPGMITLLEWQKHHVVPGGVQGIKTFENGWTVSVVAGLPNGGLHGLIPENNWEVAVMTPSGEIFGDVCAYMTSEQTHGIMVMISNFPATSTFTKWCHPDSGLSTTP